MATHFDLSAARAYEPAPNKDLKSTKVFVSYSRQDLPFVRDLVNKLRAVGIDVWMDILKLEPGETWNRKIYQALKDCTHFIVVISPYAVTSPSVQHEIEIAVDCKKNIFPVLLSGINLPEQIRQFQWIDFRTDFDRPFQHVLSALTGNASPLRTKDIDIPFSSSPPKQKTVKVFWMTIKVENAEVAAKPPSVNLVLLISGVSMYFKVLLGALSATLGALYLLVMYWAALQHGASQIAQEYFYAVPCLIILGVLGYLHYWEFKRCASRSASFGEAVGLHTIMPILLIFCFILTSYFSRLLLDFTWMVLLWVLLDVVSMSGMFLSKSFRRWMPAYGTEPTGI